MSFKVYVTSNEISKTAITLLKSIARVNVNARISPPSRTALLKEVVDADALLCLLTDRIDGTVLKHTKSLRVIGNMAVGYDNVDIQEATKRHVMVTNTPDVLTETVADLTAGLLIALSRRIVESDRYVREGKWKIRWSPRMMVGHDVYGKTLGIYGLGRIGMAVARRMEGFRMKILYYDSARNERAEKENGFIFATLEELLAASDFLTIHVPLTPATNHSIGQGEIATMKESAFLINTSRGPVVDEKALYHALARKKIAGAALDVFEREPLARDSPLTRLVNVILLPHIGSASLETRTAMAELAAHNIVEALSGRIPPNLVNREVLL